MDRVDLESIQSAKANLEALCKSIGTAVESRVVVRTGDSHTEIVEAAKELGIDLIIMATHGRSGLAHVLLGSTVEKVARQASCPILIVREHEHDFIDSLNSGVNPAALPVA
jgi:nucleotide-binding universal stress UspA family protein